MSPSTSGVYGRGRASARTLPKWPLGRDGLVFPVFDPLDPGAVIPVPGDGFFNPVFKGRPRRPAQFLLDLGGIDRVATVVAETVFDKFDKGFRLPQVL